MISMLLTLGACNRDSCRKATFEAYFNDTHWEGCVESFGPRDGDLYEILILESVKRKNSPDDLIIKGFPLAKFKKVFTEQNIDSFPAITFEVVVFDSVEDSYNPSTDGNSWMEIESIDPESREITMRLKLNMVVSRPGGPINTTYGDTIVLYDGRLIASPCN